MTKFSVNICLFLAFCLTNLSGCQTYQDGTHSKYSSSTQGVNTTELPVEKIKKGMSKSEVKSLMGEGHTNPFYPNIWTYSYIAHDKKASKTITITFKNDKVSNIEQN